MVTSYDLAPSIRDSMRAAVLALRRLRPPSGGIGHMICYPVVTSVAHVAKVYHSGSVYEPRGFTVEALFARL